jgi:hypothetical protein
MSAEKVLFARTMQFPDHGNLEVIIPWLVNPDSGYVRTSEDAEALKFSKVPLSEILESQDEFRARISDQLTPFEMEAEGGLCFAYTELRPGLQHMSKQVLFRRLLEEPMPEMTVPSGNQEGTELVVEDSNDTLDLSDDDSKDLESPTIIGHKHNFSAIVSAMHANRCWSAKVPVSSLGKGIEKQLDLKGEKGWLSINLKHRLIAFYKRKRGREIFQYTRDFSEILDETVPVWSHKRCAWDHRWAEEYFNDPFDLIPPLKLANVQITFENGKGQIQPNLPSSKRKIDLR